MVEGGGRPHGVAVKDELEVLVAHGLVEARARPDGGIGYWPTALGLALLDAVRAARRDGSLPGREPGAAPARFTE